jgi:predicted ATP-grasp superfamily ATP-dependent carboligase
MTLRKRNLPRLLIIVHQTVTTISHPAKGADKMKRESVVRKNLDLLDEFIKYAFDHPEILDEIPRDQTLVILPEGDPALERQNRKTLRHLKATGEKAVTIRLKATKRKVSKVG